VWEYPLVGEKDSSAGTLATATGLVFFGDTSQALEAVDTTSGKPLWYFTMGQTIHASPMSYSVAGKQYVAIAAGNDIFSFALP
jgi:alcohol dehydrogenase (cytochrome c)